MKNNTISFNIKMKPTGLTQYANNTVFLFIFWWQQFWQIKMDISPKMI